MSAALVRHGLGIVDEDFQHSSNSRKVKVKNVNAFNLMSDNQKVIKNVFRKGRKEKVNLLSTSKKFTVLEAKQAIKSKETILKDNLKKIKQIREASRIELDKKTTQQIIERAVTRRPVAPKQQQKQIQKTAFTEEDFKKFEEEYFG